MWIYLSILSLCIRTILPKYDYVHVCVYGNESEVSWMQHLIPLGWVWVKRIMGACWKFGYNSLSGREVMVTIAIIISAPKCSISLIFIMFFVLTLYISISHTLTKIFKWIRAKGTSVYSTTLMLNLHILEQQHWYRNRCLCCKDICECVCVFV